VFKVKLEGTLAANGTIHLPTLLIP